MGLVWLHVDKGQPGAADDGVVGAVALRRWHTTAARLPVVPKLTAKFLGPVGQRQQVIEDVRSALRSTAEGRRAAPEMVTMTTMAVFLHEYYGDDDGAAEE